MFKNRSFNVENIFSGMSNTLVGKLFPLYVARAEEAAPGNDGAPDGDNQPPQNIDKLIAAARKDEKDKLYKQIAGLKTENTDLTNRVNELILQKAALEEELTKSKGKKPAHSDADFEALQTKHDELAAKVVELEKRPTEEQIRKDLEAQYELKGYLRDQIDANKGKILEILVGEIVGSTKEEIDAAVAKAIERTKTARKSLGLPEDGEEETPAPQQQKPTGRQRVPASNPSTTPLSKLDPATIRDMSPAEWAKKRKELGMK
jgi:hypothetical protein